MVIGRGLVMDASTAILLAKIDLLRATADRGTIWMAETAFRESVARDSDDARMIRQLVEEGRIRRASPKEKGKGLADDFRLDAGEAESIAMAREKGIPCATDDGPAIRCLKVLGVPFTSAIAILAATAEAGIVAEDLAAELLTRLEQVGRYHPRILEEVSGRIRRVGVRGPKEKRGGSP